MLLKRPVFLLLNRVNHPSFSTVLPSKVMESIVCAFPSMRLRHVHLGEGGREGEGGRKGGREGEREKEGGREGGREGEGGRKGGREEVREGGRRREEGRRREKGKKVNYSNRDKVTDSNHDNKNTTVVMRITNKKWLMLLPCP